MKKYMIGFLIGIVAFGFFKLKFNPESILLRHLEKRYNKEFVIAYKGKRNIGISSWYEAEIYPKELVGSPREKDKYYWAKGFVENGKGRDTYGKVLLNESANNFYLPKLKELFGENVLPVLDLKGGYIEEDYVKEMELRNKLYKERLDGNFNPLSGGIYIFGRVESDEEREWYRKQIYEFVQFMKKTGTFEYVSLWLVVADERVLSDEFVNNKKDKEKLLRLHNENETEFRKQRAEIMKKYSKSYEETAIENIRERTDNILKSDLYDTGGNAIGLARMTYYNELLVTPLYSEKYIKSQSLEDNYKLKDYDKVEDVEFTEEFY